MPAGASRCRNLDLEPVATIIIIPRHIHKHPFMKTNIKCTEFGCSRCAKKAQKKMICGSNSCGKIQICQKKIKNKLIFVNSRCMCKTCAQRNFKRACTKNRVPRNSKVWWVRDRASAPHVRLRATTAGTGNQSTHARSQH